MPGWKSLVTSLLLVAGIVALSAAPAQDASRSAPLAIQEQGSFAVGGTVVTAPGTFDPIAQGAYNPAGTDPQGQTLHGDHAYVFYQVPVNARRLPLVFWHGHGQSAKTWETTPDGREGFQTIFLRRRYPGLSASISHDAAGRPAARSRSTIPATPDEQLWFGIFRLGVWPDLYPGVQFSRDPAALDQFFRQMVPNTGPYDVEVNTNAVAALFDKIGPGVLVTHSQSGGLGWRTAIKSKNIRAIVVLRAGRRLRVPGGRSAAARAVRRPHVHAAAPCRCRTSCRSPRSRSSSTTATTSRTNPARIRGRSSGASSAPWRGSGGTP